VSIHARRVRGAIKFSEKLEGRVRGSVSRENKTEREYAAEPKRYSMAVYRTKLRLAKPISSKTFFGGWRNSAEAPSFPCGRSDLTARPAMQFLKQDVRRRAVFTVARHLGGWAVEHEGAFLDPCPTQDEARAAANKRARACLDAGRPCQVNVRGETGFFTARGLG
jgi:hypothetical protein